MSNITYPYDYCEKKRRNVSLQQTEGQCRDLNGCADDSRCPLEDKFGCNRFGNTLNMLAAGIASGWTGGK
jgi:hypothetical protein